MNVSFTFKRYLLVLLGCVANQLCFSQPTITSFSPTSGPVGTVVTITGTNFSSVIANNKVWFGGVKATISAASATSLTVTVPTGAAYQPISVNTNSLIAWSSYPFIVTFAGGNDFVPNSFASKVDFVTGINPQYVLSADIDGDGKLDIVTANYGSNSISIFKNTGSPGVISFAAKTDFTTGTNPETFAIGDIDGDGKPDIAVANYNSNTISVFKNTSIAGTVSFALKVDYITGTGPYGVAIKDIDGDGKPDIAVPNFTSSTVSVLRNNGSVGSISFASKLDFPTGNGPNNVVLEDIDGDKKSDLVIPNLNANTVSILRNTSTPGTLSFAGKLDFPAGNSPWDVKAGDFDGDGKLDIVIANSSVASATVLGNLSTPGNISMAAKVPYGIGTSSQSVTIADLNGNGQPDIVSANSIATSVSILKNTSAASISFATMANYLVGSLPYSVSTGDFDGDGKDDIVSANTSSNTISVLQNKVTGPYIAAFTPALAGNGSTVTISGQNFTGTTSVTFGGTPAAWFTVVSQDTLVASVGTGASGNIVVTTSFGSTSLAGFTFSNVPTITSFTPERGGIGTTVIIRGTNFIGATSVSFGGTAASSFTVDSANTITAIAGNVSTGSIAISVTTPNGTASRPGFYTGPVITSFTPSSGPIGTTVVISGTHFSNVVSNNIVYFGAVRANISAATATSLTVTVPNGTTYQPVTVTSNNLTARANKPFIVTFPGTYDPFTSNSFAPKVDSPITFPYDIVAADFDNDGKTDVALVNYPANVMSVFRNTSGIGTVSFAGKIDYTTGIYPFSVSASDLDGDGKPDLVTANNQANTISIFKNNCTPGVIAFSAKTDYNTGTSPQSIAFADINSDGKTDVLVANNGSATVSVFINTSVPGTISFDPEISIYAGAGGLPTQVAIADLDGDGKPDIAVSDEFSLFNFVRNKTSGGVVAFEAPVTIEYNVSSTIDIAIGDLDGDDRPDIILANATNSAVSIFKNMSSPGNISFSPRVNFMVDESGGGSKPSRVKIADLNGDGKPEIAAVSGNTGIISIFRNTCTPGNISFDSKVDYAFLGGPLGLAICNIDGDGKPDLAVAAENANALSIFRNKNGEGNLCPGGSTTIASNLTGSSYQWQLSTDSITFNNINNNTNYSGAQSGVLQLNNIPTAWYGYEYRPIVDGIPGNVSVITFSNLWTGSQNSSWENAANWNCGSPPGINTDVFITSGTVIINSNVTIRSLHLNPGVNFTVNPGYVLTITH